MNIVEINNSDVWNDYVASLPRSSFLQMWEWGTFQQEVGRSIERLQFVEEDRILGAAQFVTHELPLGRSYVFSPRGPVWSTDFNRQSEVYELVRRRLSKYKGLLFWRLEPSSGKMPQSAISIPDVQPAVTQMLDLQVGMDKVMIGMKQKTRYNCRLAEKKGVKVSFVSALGKPNWDKQAEDFWKLLTETSQRHGIRHHNREYYVAMIQDLGEEGILEIARAEYNGQLLAMNLMIGCGDTMTYVHGASTENDKQVMAPYALQLAAIERAQVAGYHWYDMYGVAPAVMSKHKLSGVTRFKSGFGGAEFVYPGTVDFPLKTRWYALYDIVRRLR